MYVLTPSQKIERSLLVAVSLFALCFARLLWLCCAVYALCCSLRHVTLSTSPNSPNTPNTHKNSNITKGSYATLGFAKTTTDWRNLAVVLAVVGGLLGANSAVKSVTAARTTQKRRRALESLEKDN